MSVVVTVAALGLGAWLWVGPVGAQEAPAHNYVGVDACGRCHRMDRTGNQLAAWQASAHAQAYDVLASEQAQAIATERGLGNPQEAAECLGCHTTAYGVPAANLNEGFDHTKGVQCESCHGPGADYMNAGVMRDQAQAVANGLVIPTEETCTGCHNDQSPTFESFNFAEAAQAIAHPNPQGE